MKPLRDVYFQQLGIDQTSPYDKERRKAALKRAYELRAFEIEHYWKRATYFWGYQAAMFVAFGAVLSARTEGFYLISIPVAVIGFFTALANVAAAQGSKFWQENWEKHIDMLEDEFEGRLHKTVWAGDRCCHHSVSKVNRNLGWILLLFWPLAVAGVLFLWTRGAGSENMSRIEEMGRFVQSPTSLAIGALVIAFLATMIWRLSLVPLKGTTILRDGDVGSGCGSAVPLAPRSDLLVARHDPANERPNEV